MESPEGVCQLPSGKWCFHYVPEDLGVEGENTGAKEGPYSRISPLILWYICPGPPPPPRPPFLNQVLNKPQQLYLLFNQVKLCYSEILEGGKLWLR
jgi:hypothetical protein